MENYRIATFLVAGIVILAVILVLLMRVIRQKRAVARVEKQVKEVDTRYVAAIRQRDKVREELDTLKSNALKIPKERAAKVMPKKVLTNQPCSTDVITGDVSFHNTDSRKLIENGTVHVTIKKGRLSTAYISTKVDNKYTKVPITILVKK